MLSVKVSLLLLIYLSVSITQSSKQSRFKRFPMVQRMRIRERINDRIMRHRQRNTLTVCYGITYENFIWNTFFHIFASVDLVGCIELPHVNSPLQKTPEDPKALQTKYYLFRRNINFSEPEIIHISDNWASLDKSKFNYSQPLKVIVHGYLSNWNERGNLLAADAYRKLVIFVLIYL